MNIQITARHKKVSQDTQEHLKKELASLEKYNNTITSCHVIIDTETILKTVEIIVKVQGSTVSAKAKAENLGKSVDDALDKVTRQLKKYTEKLKNHKTVKESKTIL